MLLSLYLDVGDQVLWTYVSHLLTVVAVLELFDGLQTVLGGVVQVLALLPTSKAVCSLCCGHILHYHIAFDFDKAVSKSTSPLLWQKYCICCILT